jgi:hypothetical protein
LQTISKEVFSSFKKCLFLTWGRKVAGYRLGDQNSILLRSKGLLFATAFRPGIGSTQPPAEYKLWGPLRILYNITYGLHSVPCTILALGSTHPLVEYHLWAPLSALEHATYEVHSTPCRIPTIGSTQPLIKYHL